MFARKSEHRFSVHQVRAPWGLVRSGLYAIIALSMLMMQASRGTNAATSAPAGLQLAAGDYTMGSPGGMRRIILDREKQGSYEIWRVRPQGQVEYLRFTLIAPSAIPSESDEYVLRRPGADCGLLSLHIYRDEYGQSHPDILVARYGAHSDPYSSAGWTFSQADLKYDEKGISEVMHQAKMPNYYRNMSPAARAELNGGVPICKPSKLGG